MTINFKTRSRDETITDFAKDYLREHSYKKVNHYQLFDVSIPVVDEIVSKISDEVYAVSLKRDQMQLYANNTMAAVADWAKASVFRFWMEADNGPDTTAKRYLVFFATDRMGNFTRKVMRIGDWSACCEVTQLIEMGSEISLVEDAIENSDIPYIRSLAGLVGSTLLRAIMDRPHEYRLARGVRTHRERILNHPAVVTISLSKPIVHVAPNLAPGGGWHMPEHDVRGHERRYKSGKVIWVSGHKRGDPSIQRKTTYRVIP